MKQFLQRDGPTITLLLTLVAVFTVISSMLAGRAENLGSKRSAAQAGGSQAWIEAAPAIPGGSASMATRASAD